MIRLKNILRRNLAVQRIPKSTTRLKTILCKNMAEKTYAIIHRNLLSASAYQSKTAPERTSVCLRATQSRARSGLRGLGVAPEGLCQPGFLTQIQGLSGLSYFRALGLGVRPGFRVGWASNKKTLTSSHCSGRQEHVLRERAS